MAKSFQFTTLVDPKGYRWDGSRLVGQSRQAIFEKPASLELPAKEFTAKESMLFADFARLKPTHDAVLGFANEFGLLTNNFQDGEQLADWQREIEWMKTAVSIWLAAKRNDRRYLRKVIQWSPPEPPWIRGLPRPTHIPVWLEKDDFRLAALACLGAMISFRTAIQVRFGTDLDRRTKTLVVAYQTHQLAAALWLQFALAMSADKKIGSCRTCGRAIDLSDEGSRTDRSHCSDYCRLKAYRKRTVLARQMRAKGKSLAEIARALDTKTATIKKWVG